MEDRTAPDAHELSALFQSGDDWLIQRVLSHAKRLGYTRYTSTLEEAWRVSVAGLTESLVRALDTRGLDLDITCDEDVSADPAVAFGLVEARKHRERGIDLQMFLSLMKYYRSAYEDYIRLKIEDPSLAWEYRTVVERFFDRVEVGYCTEWAGLTEQAALSEMQMRMRESTAEKVRYLTVFESVNEPLLLLASDGTIDNINESAARLFGLPGVSGSAYYSKVTVGERFTPLAQEIDEFLTLERQELHFEREVETADGPKVFIVRIKRLLDVSGEFTGLTVILSDVTERATMMQELRSSQRRYESLFHNMLDAFAHHRVIRDGEGKIVDYVFLEINDAFAKMTGIVAEDALGQRVTELIPGIDVDPFDWIGAYARVVDDQTETSFEMLSEALGKWYDVQAYPTGPDTFAVVFSDVTDAKAQEVRLGTLVAERTRELQDSLDALESANKVKDDFLASMSHELRTPLNTVLGFSGMLLSGLAGDLNEEQDRQIAMIRSAGERLLLLVNDVLDLSRIEAGYVDVEVHEFDLVTLCEEVAESLRPIALSKGLELVVNYEDLVIPVWTDEDKTAQILLNIVSNALKFTEMGSVVIRPSIERNGLTANIRVTDTGRGIEPQDVPRVFERFHRANLTEPLKDGAGLGLAISQRLAELLGGDIKVDSSPGIGSTFTVSIPIRHESARI